MDIKVKWTDKTDPKKPKDKHGSIQEFVLINNKVNAIIITQIAIEVVPVEHLIIL